VKSLITSGVIATCVCVIMSCVSCAVPTPAVRTVQPIEAPAIECFFQYFVSLRALPPEALNREYARQETAFAQSHSAEDRLRLVLLLSLPDTAFENRPYALELLQAYLNESEPHLTGLTDVAGFFMTFMENKTSLSTYKSRIHDLKRGLAEKEHQLAEQQQTIKKLQADLESQRIIHSNISKKLQETLNEKENQFAISRNLDRRLRDERRNVKRLEEQIERIKDIEKSLIERDQKDNKGT
jgi:DNA repair exonuclease SbcCD ATPase subunit